MYVAENLIPSKQHLDEDEFIDLKAYSLDELKKNIYRRLKCKNCTYAIVSTLFLHLKYFFF